jgi:hypothetical protein
LGHFTTAAAAAEEDVGFEGKARREAKERREKEK